jgi:cell division protein FtsB
MAVEPKSLAKRVPAVILLGVAGYYALLGGEYSAIDLFRLSSRQNSEATQLAATRVEVDSLKTVIEQLEDDPATIEAVARERFGMVRDGDILYRFVDAEPTPADPAEP